MKDLYLVRHAAAFKRDPGSWPDDSERPLTPEGEAGFRGAARGLARVVPRLDLLLSSPFARAWRTAEILNEETGWPESASFPALEPDIPPGKIMLALDNYPDAKSVALVGHRPGLHELASYLLTGGESLLNVDLKKGGALWLRFNELPEPGTAELRWLLPPRVLRSSNGSE